MAQEACRADIKSDGAGCRTNYRTTFGVVHRNPHHITTNSNGVVFAFGHISRNVDVAATCDGSLCSGVNGILVERETIYDRILAVATRNLVDIGRADGADAVGGCQTEGEFLVLGVTAIEPRDAYDGARPQ